MIYRSNIINLELLQDLFNGKYDIIVKRNADKNCLKNIANIQDLWITDSHKEEIPESGIHANYELPWHIDKILADRLFCINNLYCTKFENGASPTIFSIMRRDILSEHRNLNITYTMPDKLDGLMVKKHFIGTTKTYSLVQEDDYGEYYFYTSTISDKDYTYLYNNENYIYTHNWKVNDLVIWNNYTVAHKRLNSPTHSRELLKQYFLDENKIFGYRRLK